MATMLRVVCLDLMDTLLHDPYREALHAGTGLAISEVAAVSDPSAWPAFEVAAIDERTFCRRFLTQPGHRFDYASFTRARREGYRWLPGMRELLCDLEGLLERWIASNYPVWIEELCARFALAACSEGLVVSHHLGVRKPAPAFYLALLERVRHDPDECLFVDDKVANCEAAEAAGLRAHLFVDAPDLTRRLLAEGVSVGVRSVPGG